MKRALHCLIFVISSIVLSAQANQSDCNNDTQAPVISNCPPSQEVGSDQGECGASVTWIEPSASDNCEVASFSRVLDPELTVWPFSSTVSFSEFPVGVTTITYTATDIGGLSTDCVFTITVNDTQEVFAFCKNAAVQLGADGTGTLTAAQIDNNSQDNCGIIRTLSRSQFDCSHVGTPQIVTLTISDAVDHTDQCEATVTVNGTFSIDGIEVTNESCAGAADGRIEIIATGINPLEYSIDGGATFQDDPVFAALADGSYDIVVQDKNLAACSEITTRSIAAGTVCELTAFDPCSCLNNASPYDMDAGTGGGDGQFAELATIAGDNPLPAGLIFKVIAPTTGVYDVYNVPAEGAQGPGLPSATDGSVVFTYNNGVYELPFVHKDGDGYTMTVVLEVEGVNAIGFQLSNTCFYPEPEITSILDGPFCSLSLPVPLTGAAGGAAGTGTFFIDGNEITVFDPALYAPGNYTIAYVFDASAALGYQLENNLAVGAPGAAANLAEAEADPGCQATVLKRIEIIPKPEGYACRQEVTVNLQENCQAMLRPEHLVGNLECVDLSGYFNIEVEDIDPGNGPIVDGCGRYRYTIKGPEGFDCWGFVTAEDKQPPSLVECPADINGVEKAYGFRPFLCEELSHLLIPEAVTYQANKEGTIDYDAIPSGVRDILDITGYAVFSDNCGDLTITVTDEVVDGNDPDCDDMIIRRTFSAVDACRGLTAVESCVQEITFSKPVLDQVYCPEVTGLACDDDFKLDSNGNPHPDETGYPWLYTAFDLTDDDVENYQSFLDQTFCNLGASYTDGARIELCPGSYQIVRTWEILDWCTQQVKTCDQIIKVLDTKDPLVVCTKVDYNNDGIADLRSYSTGPYDCTAAFLAPMPKVSDNCSEWEVLTEIIGYSEDGPVVATILPGASRYVSGIPLGCHFIRYTVTDECGNKAIEYCPFMVEDRIAPIAICRDDLSVSIGGQGLARVHADDIDAGSSDNCGPIRIEIRRRILAGPDYACLDMFDYDQDGQVIGDEVVESEQFGDPDGTGSVEVYYYTQWGDFADFTCCDMDGDVRIELRVWDDRNGDGIAGNVIEKTYCGRNTADVRDNYNVCWMDLLVEDKLPAYCVPPLPASINCDELPFDFDPTNTEQMNLLFGEASGGDNCPGFTVRELTPITAGLDDCGYGTLVRRFQVADAKGQVSTNTCEQVVTIRERHHYKIRFPKDAEANCGVPVPDTVLTQELACDLLAVSVRDQVFSASGDECYKIFRTYSVINWCEFDGISDPVVVSRDEDCDGRPGDEAVWVIVETRDEPDPCYEYYGGQQSKFYSHVWYDRDNDPFNQVPKAETKGFNCEYEFNPTGFWKEVYPLTENDGNSAYPDAYNGDHCDDMASTGYWQYTQVIKVYDNVDPLVSFVAPDPFCSYSTDLSNNCPAEVSIDFTVDENCTPDDLTITVLLDAFQDGTPDDDITNLLTGNYPNYNLTGTFPLGAHWLRVSVADGCGNAVGISIPFEVADCKAPTPICINGLAVELMPVSPPSDVDGDGDTDNAALGIWASDFIASANVDCSGDVIYSINRAGEAADPDQTGLTLTCDDDASLLIEIWAWDGLGNGDFCETYVLVQDNMVNCADDGGGAIAGIITREDVSTLANVEVSLSGNAEQSMITANDGHYGFMGLPYGFDYTVTPHLDRGPLNGVSTFDLVLMSKHVLGEQLLDSPYKLIAADVNNSRTITTLDAIQLRRLVLNIDTKFSNNLSWRFVPRAYKFPNPQTPWSPAFPEVINVNDLQAALDNQDFVAVKIGDLNLSSHTNAFETEVRNMTGRFLLQVDEREMTRGETYRIDFRASDLGSIQGYQLTLQLDPRAVEIVDVEYGIARAVNFGLHAIKDGLITTSWNPPTQGGIGYSAEDILFSLQLRAKRDISLSEVLQVSNRLTLAEAYDLNDELLDVAIDFGKGPAEAAGFELYQNVPNPFRESTMIGFYLPASEEITIRIHDLNGRTLRLMRGTYDRGYHQFRLDRRDLEVSGILYYTLAAGDFTATRKMIIAR